MNLDTHVPAQIPATRTLLQTLHGLLPQGVAVFDADLRPIYANAHWSAFLDPDRAAGLGHQPASGTGVADLLPGAGDLHVAARRCVETGEMARLAGWRRAADTGETFWDVSLAPLMADGAISGLICVVDDATARVAAEHASAAKARMASFRADVSQTLASSDDVDAVLQSCAEAMVRHAPAAFARIWVLDEADDVYRLRASAGLYTRLNGTYSRIPAAWIRQQEATFPVHEPGMAIDVLRTHPVREPDWAAEQELVPWATHPLVARGRIVGFMVMFARQNFDDDTLAELSAVADAIAQFLERKHAEAALRERELLFRNVFESAADGLVISELETQRVLAANPAVCDMHGYTCDDFTRLTRPDLVHPRARAQLHDHLTAIRAGQPSRVQLPHVRKDGSVFHVAAQGSPILYQGQSAVLGIVRDVTEEREAHERLEQRLAERTRELQTLLDMARNISLIPEVDPLLELIFDQLRQVVDYESIAIGLIEGDRYTTVAVRRDEVGQRSRNPVGTEFVVDREQFLWRELASGRTLYSPDIARADDVAVSFRRLVGDRLHTTYSHVCSVLAAPLMVANEFIGAMFVSSVAPNRYQTHDIELIAATANQIAVAIENTRLHQRTRSLAAVEERQRLARELHDSVSQALFGIGLGAETARAMLARDPKQVEAPLDYVLQLARSGMAEMRALIFELRPESLAQEGLVVALEKQAAATQSRHGIAVELALGEEPDVSLPMKEALYRIAQEAMHNTVKHARASKIELRLGAAADPLTLDVRDDGVGFDSGGAFPGHLGLVSMRERVARFGGSVVIASAPGQGTRLHVVLPRQTPA